MIVITMAYDDGHLSTHIASDAHAIMMMALSGHSVSAYGHGHGKAAWNPGAFLVGLYLHAIATCCNCTDNSAHGNMQTLKGGPVSS